jgi:AraC-like DNA-binding protein
LRNIRIRTLTNHFLLSVLDSIQDEKKATDSARFDKVLQFINKNLFNELPVSALAKEIFLSESRFKSFFKELSGFTPGDYIQRKRTELAVKMLTENRKMSIADIAYKLNFSSPQYFNTVLKKYTGLTPAIIRKQANA